MKRFQDWIWVAGFSLSFGGFISITVVALTHTFAERSAIDGRCRVLVPRYIVVCLVSYDVGLNIVFTTVFMVLLSPAIRLRKPSIAVYPASRLTTCLVSTYSRFNAQKSFIHAHQGNRTMTKKIEKLLLRTIIGCGLIMIPTIANMATLSTLRGRELSWICLSSCGLDSPSANVHRW